MANDGIAGGRSRREAARHQQLLPARTVANVMRFGAFQTRCRPESFLRGYRIRSRDSSVLPPARHYLSELLDIERQSAPAHSSERPRAGFQARPDTGADPVSLPDTE